MPVYVDGARNEFRRMTMCHMLADTVEELHAMADRLGLRRQWFQKGSTPHYDLSQSKRELALQAGAIAVDRRELVALIRRLRGAEAYADCEAKGAAPRSIEIVPDAAGNAIIPREEVNHGEKDSRGDFGPTTDGRSF